MHLKDHMENRPEMKTAKRAFSKVLVSSVCTILLCAACLVGTAWAWYTVSIENKESFIQIGETKVTVEIDGAEVSSGVTVSPKEEGETHMVIKHGGSTDVFQRRSTIYMTFAVDGESCGTVSLSKNIGINLNVSQECTLSWTTSWAKPESMIALTDVEGKVSFEIVEIEEIIPETTAPAETEAATQPGTEPAETTAPPEETTAPPAETTAPPEETTAPPAETTAPPEETTAPPEETTAPPEETTAPPQETTAPPQETTGNTEQPTGNPEESSETSDDAETASEESETT